MERLKEILAFVNDKGGVGKTTTVHNLAYGLARIDKNARILIIDLDAQAANISLLMGWKEQDHPLERTMYDCLSQQVSLPAYNIERLKASYDMPTSQSDKRIWLAPASTKLLSIEPFLLQALNPLKVLCKVFAQPITLEGEPTSIIEAFDYVLIDCPPAMNLVTKNAMTVATGIIVPMQLEALATFGSSSVIKWAQDIKAELNPDLDLRGILKVMVDKRTNASKEFSEHINEEYGDYVFKTEIPRRTKIVEAQAMLQDIFTYKPYDDAGMAYERFAKEIITTYKE